MKAFHHDRHRLNLPAGHRFPQQKYARLHEVLAQRLPAITYVDAPRADDVDLLRVHDAAWLEAVAQGLSVAQARELGFPWSQGMDARARHSVGATLAACAAAQADGVAANLGGGTHHAQRSHGSGYCVFNDVAVAAARQLSDPAWGQQQMLVIDLDVHQGNGTAAIFADEPRVFTLSLHGARNFPFRKSVSDLDVELPDATGDADYLRALRHAMEVVEARLSHPPALIFYLAGADIHEGDRLGRLKVTTQGVRARDELVFDWAARHGAAVVLCMAGGYGNDLEQMIEVQVGTVETAWRHSLRRRDGAWQGG